MRPSLPNIIVPTTLVALAILSVGGAAFAQALPTWNGSFSDATNGQSYAFNYGGRSTNMAVVLGSPRYPSCTRSSCRS